MLGDTVDNDAFLDDLPNAGNPAPAQELRQMPMIKAILDMSRPHKRHLIGINLVKALTALALFPSDDLESILRIYSERTIQVSGFDVAQLRAYYARLQPMAIQIHEAALAAGGSELNHDKPPVYQTPVRPQLGQMRDNGGVFCRLTKGRIIHAIAFWTPLGGLNVWNGSRLPESFYDSMIARYAMTPVEIRFRPPFWDATDTLYRVGVDADGKPFGDPEQTPPPEVIDSVRSLAIWRSVVPEGRQS